MKNYTHIVNVYTPRMGNSASSEQDAVKKQAEGGSVPMYGLVDLKGKFFLVKIWINMNDIKYTTS